jgi:hypothetical protein
VQQCDIIHATSCAGQTGQHPRSPLATVLSLIPPASYCAGPSPALLHLPSLPIAHLSPASRDPANVCWARCRQSITDRQPLRPPAPLVHSRHSPAVRLICTLHSAAHSTHWPLGRLFLTASHHPAPRQYLHLPAATRQNSVRHHLGSTAQHVRHLPARA